MNQSRLRFDLAVVVELMFGCYPRFCWLVAFSILAGNMIIHLRLQGGGGWLLSACLRAGGRDRGSK